MISYEALLNQMAQNVQAARESQNEQQLREQLSAVKALCDVVLNASSVHTTEVIYPQQQTTSTTVANLQSSKLQESDANGDSIFDF